MRVRRASGEAARSGSVRARQRASGHRRGACHSVWDWRPDQPIACLAESGRGTQLTMYHGTCTCSMVIGFGDGAGSDAQQAVES
jgi:hypothetical protein